IVDALPATQLYVSLHDTATRALYPLSLHDALPITSSSSSSSSRSSTTSSSSRSSSAMTSTSSSGRSSSISSMSSSRSSSSASKSSSGRSTSSDMWWRSRGSGVGRRDDRGTGRPIPPSDPGKHPNG